MSTKTFTDHIGQKFSSRIEMCKAWGITISQLEGRLSKGWSLEEALTTPKNKSPGETIITDHLDNTYSSIDEMCRTYNISDSTYQGRLAHGYTQEEALTLTTEEIKNRKVKDHLGNEYPSIRAMCDHYGMTSARFFGRRKLGWPLEKILTAPDAIVYPDTSKIVKDHLGNEFPSENEMCKFWGIARSTYRLHIREGWSIERALTTKKKNIKICKTPQTDHLGQKFPSLSAMCQHWNISRTLYSSRIKQGWSIEKALTTKEIIINSSSVEDYMGRIFPTTIDACNFYGAPAYALQGKDRDEKTMRKAYTYMFKPYTEIGDYLVVKKLSFPYFVVAKGDEEIICDIETLLDIYHNSDAFTPIPNNAALSDIEIVKCIEFPYYEIKYKNESQVWTYWQLIQYRHDDNYCLNKNNKGE